MSSYCLKTCKDPVLSYNRYFSRCFWFWHKIIWIIFLLKALFYILKLVKIIISNRIKSDAQFNFISFLCLTQSELIREKSTYERGVFASVAVITMIKSLLHWLYSKANTRLELKGEQTLIQSNAHWRCWRDGWTTTFFHEWMEVERAPSIGQKIKEISAAAVTAKKGHTNVSSRFLFSVRLGPRLVTMMWEMWICLKSINQYLKYAHIHRHTNSQKRPLSTRSGRRYGKIAKW